MFLGLGGISVFLGLMVPTALGLNNGLSEHPPMGWSALYGAPFGQVNETILKAAADGLNRSGLLALGYEYITIDDWWAVRDANGDIMADPKTFPSGMAATGQYVHSRGCKFGVYSAAGERTCGNRSASLFNEVRDADTFANDFMIDFLKYDACRYTGGVGSRARYLAMSRALNKTGREIFYSVEGWNPADGDWGPEVANMWRTGSDIWPNWDHDLSILNNLYQTNEAAQYNRYSMEAAGSLGDHAGGGFNDGDMLQPPNTLITVLKPGLAPEESMSQFKLWAIMKAPLILATHWTQLAELETLAPEYFALVSNTEMIALNQERSPQAKLVSQTPSPAQQANVTGLNVTTQLCDLSRPDQRFAPSGSTAAGGTKIALADSTLCLTVVPGSPSATAMVRPCAGVMDTFALAQDDELTIAMAYPAATTPMCLTSEPNPAGADVPVLDAAPCKVTTPIDHHSKVDPVPLFPVGSGHDLGGQTFVWDSQSGQIVASASGQCLTVGNPNVRPAPYSNHFTLEHEVWAGPLVDSPTGAKRRVVALFNKGSTTETLSAASVYTGTDKAPATVRDVVEKQDLHDPLPRDGVLSVPVPSHGVRVFVLTSTN